MSKTNANLAPRLLPKDEGYIPYLWLVYMAATFIYPVAAGSRSVLIETAVAAAAGLVLYFRGYWVEDGPGMLWIVGGFTLIGALAGIVNPFTSTYFVYAASFAPFAGPPRVAWRVVIALEIWIAAEAAILHLTAYFWLPGMLFTAIIGAAMVHSAEIRRMNADLRAAREDVEQFAKIAERERIARDLHDVLGHTLSVIVLKSELASKLAESDVARAAQEIREVERIARESLAELREALAGYRAAGLTAEIERAGAVLRAAGVRFECEVEPVRLAPRAESVLSLAIREGVTNVVRHAGASSCRLRISPDGRRCRLELIDDGNGRAGNEGMGLRGMRERIEEVGGSFAREAAGGTRLVVIVPAGAQ